MATAATRPPGIGSNERLGATLVLSLLVHGLLILGVGFAIDDAAPVVPTLDVIFSRTSTPLTPKEADFLAEASQQGGGNSDAPQRPRDSQPGSVPTDRTGLAPEQRAEQVAAAAPPPETRVVAGPRGKDPIPSPPEHPRVADQAAPGSDASDQQAAEMARLSAEIAERQALYAKRPSRKFVSASTKEYAYAGYLRAWVDRAERVGNLNFPDDVRRRRLSGRVVLNVGIRRDGSIESARVLRSSGVPLLDDTALRIVRLAAPFPPLPHTREKVDVLQITRTWLFLADGRLRDVPQP